MILKPNLLFAAIIPLLFLNACQKEQAEKQEIIQSVRAIKLIDTGIVINDVYPGRAKATQEANLSFRVSGPLIALPVDIGDKVKKGDVLARIDPRDFEVALQKAKGQLSRSRVALIRADKEYKRFLDIQNSDPGFISQSKMDMTKAMRDEAKANSQSLMAAVKTAKDRLLDTYLKATFDGTVGAKYVENYEYVNARLPIIRILDSSAIKMVVNVPETKISLVPYIKSIKVRFDAFPEHDIIATIKEVGFEASQTTRTYPVTLIMDQPTDITILPGMAGNASPEVSEQLEQLAIETAVTLIIPATAVFSPTPDGKSYVWVVNPDNKTVSRRAVILGELTNTGIPVTNGVKSGEWIVTAGVSYLQEGQQVKILQEERL